MVEKKIDWWMKGSDEKKRRGKGKRRADSWGIEIATAS